MADTITLIPQDDEAGRILDAFEQQTGLEPDEGDGGARVYEIDGDDHRIRITQTLTGIDAGWSEHVALGSPA
jgi:hypothetical protein